MMIDAIDVCIVLQAVGVLAVTLNQLSLIRRIRDLELFRDAFVEVAKEYLEDGESLEDDES